MPYTVTLYANTSAPNHISKNITQLAEVSCEFKAPISVENPTIYISATASYVGCNYVYIPAFARYYYATCTGGTSQTLTFECKSDPLMSFANQIKSSKAVVARNPWRYDKYIHDPKLPLEARTITATYKFPNRTHFKGDNNSYILTTIGSGGSST